MKKSFLLLLISSVLIFGIQTFAATKTWNGGTGTGKSWTTSSNWSPSGAPASNDDIVFNTAGTITFSTMPSSVTYKSLTISQGTVTLAHSSSTTLTLGGNTSTDFIISSGASLTLGTNVNITMASSATGSIAGTLTVNSSRTFDTDGTSVVTTVTGSLVNSGTVAGATSKLVFSSGSTYEHAQNGGVIPTASWDAASTCLITGITTTVLTGSGQTFGNFTWNCAGQNFSSATALGTSLTVHDLNIMNTGTNSTTGQFRIQTTPITVNGNVNISGGTMWVAGQATKVMEVLGNFNINGGTLDIMGYNSTSYSGTLNLHGNFSHTSGTLKKSGASTNSGIVWNGTGDQTYSSIGHTGMINFTVNKASGNVILNSNLTVGDTATLTMTSGNIITNSNTLTLGSLSSITGETSAHYVIGNLFTTKSVGTSSSTMGGIGLSFATGSSLGTVTVTRYSGVGSHITAANGNQSIDRLWMITSTTAGSRTATFNFIVPGEVNGLDLSSNAQVFSSTDVGTSWNAIGVTQVGTDGSVDASISLSASSSLFTVANGADSPLPVELESFAAASNNRTITLTWTTSTEKNNFGFDIEKKVGNEWNKLGFIQGSGNSNSTKKYSFSDKVSNSGSYSYRLKQIDNDGKYTYSDPVAIEVSLKPAAFSIANYPNPFNPDTRIQFELPQAARVNLTIYNIVGQKVATLVDDVLEAGTYQRTFSSGLYGQLTSGIYFYRLTTDNGINITKKMILAK